MLCVFLFLASSPALAEKWYFEPSVRASLGYSDNLQLSTNSEIETFTSSITADAALGFRTNVSDVSITAKMIDRRFDDNAYLNTNNQFFNLKSSYRSGLNLFGLGAAYERESTRTSEFDFTGYSNTNKIRITKAISPYFDRTLTERASIRVGGNYTDVAYEDAEFTGLSDYTNSSAYTSLQYRLSERTTLQAVLSASLYSSTGSLLYGSNKTEFDTTSLQLGINHMFSETLSLNALIGPNYTESTYTSGTTEEEFSSVGKLIDIGLRKQFELGSLSASIKTSESAGGAGKMTSKSSLNLSLNRKMSERTTFALSSTFQQNESGGGRTDPGDDRTYFSIEPRINWKASRWWTISGSYHYRQSEYTSSDAGPAESNAVYITVRYVWPKESLSRWMEL